MSRRNESGLSPRLRVIQYGCGNMGKIFVRYLTPTDARRILAGTIGVGDS